LSIVSLGIFGYAWAIVQAVWARKFDPENKALTLYVVAITLSIFGAVLEIMHADVSMQALVQLAAALVATFGAFSVRNSLADYTTNIAGAPTYLSGLMTIVFGEVYLQYHMNRVRSLERRHRHGTFAPAQ